MPIFSKLKMGRFFRFKPKQRVELVSVERNRRQVTAPYGKANLYERELLLSDNSRLNQIVEVSSERGAPLKGAMAIHSNGMKKAGGMLFFERPTAGGRSELILSNVLLDAKYRQKGLFHQMLTEASVLAKRKGIPRISLAVEEKNTNAIEAYRKAGFKEISRYVQDSPNDLTGTKRMSIINMSIDLSPNSQRNEKTIQNKAA